MTMLGTKLGINKNQEIFLAWTIVILAIIFLYLYYSGFSTTPKVNIKTVEKTTEQLKQKAKSMMLAGKLDSFAGKITKIEGEYLSVNVATSSKNVAEEKKVKITKNTLIRKIKFQNIPKDSKELIPAKETIISLTELKIGDDIFISTTKGGDGVIVDFLNNPVSDQQTNSQVSDKESAAKTPPAKSKNIKTFSGELTKIDSNKLFVKITKPCDTECGKEIIINVTDNTSIKKIEIPYAPKGSIEPVSAKYTIISLTDLGSGDKIFTDVDVVGENNNAIIINLIR